LLKICREQVERQINPGFIFAEKPTVYIEPSQSVCTCASQPTLLVRKTKKREVRTLHIGHFVVHETIKECPSEQCRRVYRNTELDVFLPVGANFGYDVLEYVGKAVWRKSQAAAQIQADLKMCHNLTISESEVTYLAKKFVHYMAEAHQDKLQEIRQFLHSGGGWFLYFDAMHPGQGSSHFMCAVAEEIAEKVNIVLGSVKLPKESTETVAAFLRELKEKYGNPLAGICDMLASNLAAFKKVFPGVLLLICHFHFLRSIGKDFLEYENTKLQGTLKQYNVNQRLRDFLKGYQESIEENQYLLSYLQDGKKYQSSFHTFPAMVQAYCMVQWILVYEQELNGYGMPFDRSDFVFCQRMQKAYDCLQEYPQDCKELSELRCFLATFLEDPGFKKQMNAMTRKVEDFDRLRDIMRIAPTIGMKGLNDDGEECNMTAMENELKAFIESTTIKDNPEKDYKKMIGQIKKYWKMLFAKPVEAHLPNGDIVSVYPQRTSNVMERMFREFQRSEYKRTGMGTLGRTVRAMISETPMMKNIESPEYMKIILNGQPTLAARFAQLDSKRVQERMAKEGSWNNEKLPAGLRKIMSDPSFYRVAKRAAQLIGENVA
jgi:hypothetical protein